MQIYDKKKYALVTNFPFKVRALINAKEARTGGGCKKAIRLLKNMKEDADSTIALSSFDIMSLVYAMQDFDLVHQSYYEGESSHHCRTGSLPWRTTKVSCERLMPWMEAERSCSRQPMSWR